MKRFTWEISTVNLPGTCCPLAGERYGGSSSLATWGDDRFWRELWKTNVRYLKFQSWIFRHIPIVYRLLSIFYHLYLDTLQARFERENHHKGSPKGTVAGACTGGIFFSFRLRGCWDGAFPGTKMEIPKWVMGFPGCWDGGWRVFDLFLSAMSMLGWEPPVTSHENSP